jgi:hypothetical protein
LRGFAAVKLPNMLVINDIVVGEASGPQWAMLPGKPMLDAAGDTLRDDSGRIRYSQVIEWSGSELRTEFSKRVVELIRAHYPTPLMGPGNEPPPLL